MLISLSALFFDGRPLLSPPPIPPYPSIGCRKERGGGGRNDELERDEWKIKRKRRVRKRNGKERNGRFVIKKEEILGKGVEGK